MKYLSQEYLDKQKELAQGMQERPQANISMNYVITGGPEGDVKDVQKWDKGHPVESKLGEDPDAEETMTVGHADSVALAKGEVGAPQAIKTGKVLATGNKVQVR